MVKVTYPARLISDYEFLEWLNKNQNSSKIIMQLMNIKASSEFHKKEHNVIIKNDYDKAKDNSILGEGKLLASFKPMDLPDFLLNERNEISRNIRFAIWLESLPNYKKILLTSKEKQRDYEGNPHIAGLKNISIKSDNDAVALINEYYKEFCFKKEQKRGCGPY